MDSDKIVFCSYCNNGDNNVSICARNLSTGLVVMTYRGEACKDLVLVDNTYLVGADEVRPKILVWVLNKKDAIHTIPCPSRVRSLSASNAYIVAGIETSIYVWMIATGQLLRTVEHHLQNVTSVKLQHNTLLVSADEEGCVAVWSLHALLQRTMNNDPLWRSNEHTNRVNNLSIQRVGCDDFIVASASQDRSVRVWRGPQMRLMHVIEHPHAATCIAIDLDLLLVSFEDGSLRISNLFDQTKSPITIPHKSRISSMAVVGDGRVLVGMESGEVALAWYKRPPHRLIPHPGRVTCLVVADGLQEGWNESSCKPTSAFSLLRTHTDSVVKEIGLVVRGHRNRTDVGLRQDDKVVKRAVIEVEPKHKPCLPIAKRKKIINQFIENLYKNNQ